MTSGDSDAPAVRERILDAAFAVLGERGVRRLTQTAVAERAGVRQSHLTYYFPSRYDLLEAVTTRFADRLGAELAAAGEQLGRPGGLAALLEAVVEPGHMRSLLGLIVGADEDPRLRAVLTRATERVVESLAAALGGRDAASGARVVLATMWGMGLYAFAVRPSRGADPSRRYLAWVEKALRGDRPSRLTG